MYNRFKDVKLPIALGFFSGRRSPYNHVRYFGFSHCSLSCSRLASAFSALVAFVSPFIGLMKRHEKRNQDFRAVPSCHGRRISG